MRGEAKLWLFLVLAFHGCAYESLIFGDEYGHAPEVRYPGYTFSAYSRSFDNPWVGRSSGELVEALGPPDAIHEAGREVTDYRKEGIRAKTYVYRGARDASSRCIDAYVVAEPTSTVIKYYCR